MANSPDRKTGEVKIVNREQWRNVALLALLAIVLPAIALANLAKYTYLMHFGDDEEGL